jgi:excisionase family DNA binding protein
MGGEEATSQVYSPAEVGRILGVHRYTVYKLLKAGDMRGFRVSNRWKVPKDELHRFMTVSSHQVGAEEQE